MNPKTHLSIGEAAKRSGVSIAALRFYEEKGLISSHRNAGNQRLFHRSALRTIAVIKTAQSLGLSLGEIHLELSALRNNAVASQEDWTQISTQWRDKLDQRINRLVRLRTLLDGCIGCGCLSLQRCQLYNPDDVLQEKGTGAQLLRIDETNHLNKR